MIVLGIEPGYAIVGWGVVDYQNTRFRPLAYGAITTPADMEFSARLERIYDEMSLILAKYKPQEASVEELFFTNNKTTGIGVGQARGVILLACRKAGVPVSEYTPMQVKQAVVGYGKAEKKQVMEMTKVLLSLPSVPKPDDTADALAMAICHGHCAGSLYSKLMRRG
ncbi:MAG TPA: crossover junction endodeoxyribonuclease RuvC [Ruminococcaceae bacterium]|nr:crossover junction endodeoxyribonuclease RuvC [Oscillospiraceae bacterium]